MVQDVVDVEAHRVDRLDAGDVARRKLDVLVLILRDDEALGVDAEIAEHLDDALRLGRIEIQIVEDDEIIVFARHKTWCIDLYGGCYNWIANGIL